nr:MAG TPA: hypothetical protein [Caudoviricetes sp.]
MLTYSHQQHQHYNIVLKTMYSVQSEYSKCSHTTFQCCCL